MSNQDPRLRLSPKMTVRLGSGGVRSADADEHIDVHHGRRINEADLPSDIVPDNVMITATVGIGLR